MTASDVKRDLRKRIIELRDALPVEKRLLFSEAITEKMEALEAYKKAKTVLAYMSFGSEFMTQKFVEGALKNGKRLALPRLKPDRSGLDLCPVSDLDRELEVGIWGIREPIHAEKLNDFSVIDFILVPGVAFGEKGERLGYGGGFYDRLLVERRKDAAVVAAAFSLQIVQDIPLEEYDMAVDMVITEKGML